MRFCSGRGKKHFLVGQTFDIPILRTYRVGQFRSHQGGRRYVESWIGVTRVLLLRF